MSDCVFSNHDRVSHEIKGLGTVSCDPASDDVVAEDAPVEWIEAGVRLVYVIWDDDRFPVEKVPVGELDKLSDADAAISSGY